MPTAPKAFAPIAPKTLQDLLLKHWGYDVFRPIQQEAMAAVFEARDSLTILSTGGGKSLCYQLPALALPGTAIVVSPLIALIKNQIDALEDRGIPARTWNAGHGMAARRQVVEEVREGRVKLLYFAPETLFDESGALRQGVSELFDQATISFVAIDEAHCISQWGHEFRPAYRMLGNLRRAFPGVALHAFTATATERVRGDIARSLQHVEPQLSVGDHDRPNLIYRTAYRQDTMAQVLEVLERHPDEAGIIYANSRKQVEELAESLRQKGYRARPYHAKLADAVRSAHQDEFTHERIDIIVATVAFGMGIDRSNVRYVLHVGLPKSMEHYQQEAGRAGRDGLKAECVLLYSASDLMQWRDRQEEPETPIGQAALQRLQQMYSYAQTFACRHRLLVNYFGQEFPAENCEACDVCLGEKETLPHATHVASRLLEAVRDLRPGFGAQYVIKVLRGSNEARIKDFKHDQLPLHGALKEHSAGELGDWLEQLFGMGLLERKEYGVLALTPEGHERLASDAETPLSRTRKQKRARQDAKSPVDAGLFAILKQWRQEKARAIGLPPYVIFSDKTLHALIQAMPSDLGALQGIYGIGSTKAERYGPEVLEILGSASGSTDSSRSFSTEGGSTIPNAPQPAATPVFKGKAERVEATRRLFEEGRTVEQIAEHCGVLPATILGYLATFVSEGTLSLHEVVDETQQHAIDEALAAVGEGEDVLAALLLPASIELGLVKVVQADARRRGRPPLAIPPGGENLRELIERTGHAGPDVEGVLVTALSDPDPRIRSVASYRVARLLPAEALRLLVPRLQSELDLVARRALLRSCSASRNPAFIPHLQALQPQLTGECLDLAQRAWHRLDASPALEPALSPNEATPSAPLPEAPGWPQVLQAISNIEFGEKDSRLAIAEVLIRLGFTCKLAHAVPDRGDGQEGRVDLVARHGDRTMAVALGDKIPSYEALFQLGQVAEAYRVLVLADTPFDHVPEFADALVVVGPSKRVRRREP